MKQIVSVYKPKGRTPLEVINKLRIRMPEYKSEKIGFAGRLDPLAHGVLLLMVGEEATRQKDQYLNLSKEYEFEAVFGMQTDTYDTLGMVKEIASSSSTPRNDEEVDLEKNINTFIASKLGKQQQIYPPFSSKTVEGKPLFLWAKENRLAEITIPEREIEIYDFKLLEIDSVDSQTLEEMVVKQVQSVQGDFRQKEIQKSWEAFFRNNSHSEFISESHGILKQVQDDKIKEFQIARFKIACSSGTYVRSLVNELGEQLGCGAITLEILRTKVGDYTLEDSLRM